ncbi:hypothetical protein CsSME_00051543 [Camellia sinensis var. sinensis]
MESSFLDKLQEIAKQFFVLPIEEKHKYSRTVEDLEGYGNDSVFSEHQILDWTDRLYLIVSPEDQRKLKFWPQNPECFREILHDYTTKLAILNELILKSMAKSLNLEENCFLNQYGERATMFARFNFYPPCPRPDRTLGLKPHADGTAITFLLQDKEVEGLQILKDGQWFRVPIIPHALLINVGDQAEVSRLDSRSTTLHIQLFCNVESTCIYRKMETEKRNYVILTVIPKDNQSSCCLILTDNE